VDEGLQCYINHPQPPNYREQPCCANCKHGGAGRWDGRDMFECRVGDPKLKSYVSVICICDLYEKPCAVNSGIPELKESL
jgi:hypothetical protein